MWPLRRFFRHFASFLATPATRSLANFFFVSLLSQTLDNVVLLFRRHSISVATADADPTFLAVDLVEIDVVFASSRFVCLFVFFLFFLFFHPQSSFPFPCAVLGRCHGLLAINEKGKEKPKKRKKEITFGALAVRVEVGDGGRRGVFEAEEAGADEALAPGAAHDLHFGILRHVLLQLRLQVLCCRPSSTRSPSKEKKKRTIDRCLATLCSRVEDTFDASPFDRT